MYFFFEFHLILHHYHQLCWCLISLIDIYETLQMMMILVYNVLICLMIYVIMQLILSFESSSDSSNLISLQNNCIQATLIEEVQTGVSVGAFG